MFSLWCVCASVQEHYCLAVGVLGDEPDGWLAEALQLQQLAALTS